MRPPIEIYQISEEELQKLLAEEFREATESMKSAWVWYEKNVTSIAALPERKKI